MDTKRESMTIAQSKLSVTVDQVCGWQITPCTICMPCTLQYCVGSHCVINSRFIYIKLDLH